MKMGKTEGTCTKRCPVPHNGVGLESLPHHVLDLPQQQNTWAPIQPPIQRPARVALRSPKWRWETLKADLVVSELAYNRHAYIPDTPEE